MAITYNFEAIVSARVSGTADRQKHTIIGNVPAVTPLLALAAVTTLLTTAKSTVYAYDIIEIKITEVPSS
jgi:hypothetical protein